MDHRLIPSPPYAGLIFDCDGTIAHTLPVQFQALRTTFTIFGSVLPEAWYYDHVSMTLPEFVQAFNQEFGAALRIDQIEANRQQQFAKLLDQVEAIEAVAEIARINAGIVPMAIASNGQRTVVEATIEATGLRSLFQTIVTLDDVAAGKPSPDLFLCAAARMGVRPTECIVYEDSDVGLEAARRAGMRWIDVRRILGQNSPATAN